VRVFTALPLPAPQLEKVAALAGRLARLYPKLRVVRPEGMHVTMIFLGELSQAQTEAVRQAMRDPALAVGPLAVSMGGLGQFPPRGVPRVLYCPIRRGAEAVAALHAALREALRPVDGLRLEERPFTPHITLARNNARGLAVSLEQLAADFDFEDTFSLERLVLYESLLRPSGAEYRPLQTVSLAGGAVS
jgi:2'-5' RNA ligase